MHISQNLIIFHVDTTNLYNLYFYFSKVKNGLRLERGSGSLDKLVCTRVHILSWWVLWCWKSHLLLLQPLWFSTPRDSKPKGLSPFVAVPGFHHHLYLFLQVREGLSPWLHQAPFTSLRRTGVQFSPLSSSVFSDRKAPSMLFFSSVLPLFFVAVSLRSLPINQQFLGLDLPFECSLPSGFCFSSFVYSNFP